MAERPECAETRVLIPELAAGVSAGDERARALSHLGGCSECRRELTRTADVVDELLLLAPEEEPPPGFETAALARLDAPPPTRRRLRVATAVAASVVAAAALAAAAVWRMTAEDRSMAAEYRHTLEVAHGKGLSAAPLLSDQGAEAGTMFAYQGRPSWVYATFRFPPSKGIYTVHLMARNGMCHKLREFNATGGIAWGSTIDVDVRDIVALQFIRADDPVMTARFP